MAQGPFTDSIYASDEGYFFSIKVQPETLAATLDGVANAAGTGPVDQVVVARVSGSRRGYGVFARTVRLKVTAAGTSGEAVGAVLTIPALTPAFYAKGKKGFTGTYNGATVKALGRSPERIV